MELSRDQRLAKGSVDVAALPLTPQEFFVFSRVEGTLTLREIVASSGLGVAEAERIVAHLVELGALTPCETTPDASPVGARQSTPLREKARDRRRRLLQAQLRAADRTARQEASAAPAPEHEPVESEPVEREPDESDVELERVHVEIAAAGDPRLDPSLAIPLDDQRRILGTIDRIDALTPFELLGIAPTHDTRAIRRAYHETSRRLHPDAFYGRNLGEYRDRLGLLFHRVKLAHEQLRDESVREPLVHAHAEAQARLQQAREQRRRAMAAAEEARHREAEAAAQTRRKSRLAERLRSERERVLAAMRAEAERQEAEAVRAEEAGDLGTAANLYRLALQAWPDNSELEGRWRACLARARTQRAANAFRKAIEHAEVGQHSEAANSFVEAAEANPTSEHLAHAADAIRSRNPAKARAFALAALKALGPAPTRDLVGKDAMQRGALHLMIARAFLAAGQRESAREQARVAQRLRPNDRQVRALLNSIKVT